MRGPTKPLLAIATRDSLGRAPVRVALRQGDGLLHAELEDVDWQQCRREIFLEALGRRIREEPRAVTLHQFPGSLYTQDPAKRAGIAGDALD